MNKIWTIIMCAGWAIMWVIVGMANKPTIKANCDGPLLTVSSEKDDEKLTMIVMNRLIHTNYTGVIQPIKDGPAFTNKNGTVSCLIAKAEFNVITNEFPMIVYKRGTNMWAIEMFKVL